MSAAPPLCVDLYETCRQVVDKGKRLITARSKGDSRPLSVEESVALLTSSFKDKASHGMCNDDDGDLTHPIIAVFGVLHPEE